MPLCGDATFKTLPIAGGGTGATTALNAIKAFLGSSAIGSTTKPVYYDGNGALKACAESIGGGGIVAALLEQNGYVKFANGLIIQWGITNEDMVSEVTFPIAFSVACYIGIFMGINEKHNGNPYKWSGYAFGASNTKISFRSDDQSCRKYWLSIGK